MKRLLVLTLAVIMILSLTACASEPEVTESKTATEESIQEQVHEEEVIVEIQGDGWMYNLESKTLQVDGLMEDFELDGNGVSTAPWGEYLVETEHIIVGENMNWISPNAFANCPSLKAVDVKSQNFEYIETNAFYMCGDIENQSELVFTFNSAPGYGDDAFFGTIDNPNAVVIVPDMYKGSWGYYLFQKPMHVKDYEYAPKNMDEIVEISFDRARFVDWCNAEDLYKQNGGGWNKNNTKVDFSEEKMTFTSGKKTAKIYLRDRFNKNYDSNGETQQAVVLKFVPEDATDLSFNFKDKTEFSIDFKEEDIYFNYKANDGEIAFSEYMPNDFELKSDSSYYFFFAFDADANIRALVYEEDNYLNRAEFETSLYKDSDKIFDNGWRMSILFGKEQQFSICEYSVWTFENFAKSSVESKTSESNDEENNNVEGSDEYGPYWEIDMGNDFYIMSDMVWHEFDPQDFKIGSGDTFKGYVLKDFLDMAGNSSDVATVVFKDGSEAEANPTFDTFIVFEKNGEFLGAPYMLSLNGFSDQPVVKVSPK